MYQFGIIIRAELVPYSNPNPFKAVPDAFEQFTEAVKKLEGMKTPSISDLQVMELSYLSVGEDIYGKNLGFISADALLLGKTELSQAEFMDVIEASIRHEVASATEEQKASGTHISSFGGVRLYHFNKEEYMEWYNDNVPTSSDAYREAAEASRNRHGGAYQDSSDDSDADTSSDNVSYGGLQF